jgi:acyl-CoA reductase-like NAD-dependent aldehyde dehydrogenase
MLENLQKFYINGKWVDPFSHVNLPVINPATELKIGDITMDQK